MDSETVWQADAAALADRISALLTVVRSAEVEIGSLLAEIESRGVMELFGYRSVARLFEHLADVPKAAAETVVKRARALTPSRTLDGPPIPAVAPATGVAASDGRLSSPMIDTIVGVMTQVPTEHRDDAEQHLLTFAAEAGHKQVAALGARILAHLDPDGAEPDETEPAMPSRELSLRRKRTGFWELNGRFDDETGARASALLDSLAERRSTDEGPDLRSPLERYGDAFSDAIDLAFNSPELPTQAGERAHVMVAVSLADLRSGIGQAMFGDTGTTSAAGPVAPGGTVPKPLPVGPHSATLAPHPKPAPVWPPSAIPAPRPRRLPAKPPSAPCPKPAPVQPPPATPAPRPSPLPVKPPSAPCLGPASAGPCSATPAPPSRPLPAKPASTPHPGSTSAGPPSATLAPSPPPKPASTPATAN